MSDRILRCECGYETTVGSPSAVTMDGSCPDCGRPLDPTALSSTGTEQSRCTRYCGDCDDETRHRQVGDDSYECLACHERIEIEAALGIGGGESGR